MGEFETKTSLARTAPKDIAKGTDLVRKPAQRGHPVAQQILGDIYAFGVGLPKDQRQAAVWYKRAANAGNARAQVSLGGMLIAGNGVDKNPAEGLKWVKLAAKGSPGVVPVLKIMEKSLSPDVIRDAEARAAKFVPRRTIDPANPVASTRERGHYPDDPIRSLTDAIDRKDHTLAVKIARDLPSELNGEFVEWTKGNKDRIPPLFLYLMASRQFTDDPEDALRWLYLGVLRASYDAMRCSDKTARSALRSMLTVAQNVAVWAKDNPEKAKLAGLWALDHDERHRSTVPPLWVCLHGIEGYKATLEKKKWDPYVPEHLWA